MVSETPTLPQQIEARRREQRALWRLTAWGAAAALSLMVAAVVSQTPTGKKRLHMALARTLAPDNAVILSTTERRADAAQAENKQLAAKLRALSADRDRLSRHLANLKRSMNEMTGSISRQLAVAKSAPAASPPALPSPRFAALALPTSQAAAGHWAAVSFRSRPAKPAGVVHTPASLTPAAAPSEATAVPLRSMPVARPEVMVAPLPAPSAAALDVSHAPPVPQVSPPLAPKELTPIKVPMPPMRVAELSTDELRPASKTQYAVDLGGAHSRDFLRAQWIAAKTNFGPLFADLHARVAHDRRTGHEPYRLLIGPLASYGAAARLCAHLGLHPCHAARFAGRPLAER